MKNVLFLIAVATLLASCGTTNKCRKAEKNWGKYRYGMNIELIDESYWLVDANANRVLINDPAKVEQEIAEHGFDVVFNHYAGISSGNDPLAPKVSLPIRETNESEAEYSRRVLRSIGHPAASKDDKEVIFIASVILEREGQ